MERIGEFAFCKCKSLQTIKIPKTVITVGEMSFYGCKRLKTANIPYHIQNIEDVAFEEKTQIIRTKYKDAEEKTDS